MEARRVKNAPHRVSRRHRLVRCLGAAFIGLSVAVSARGQSSVTLAWDPSPSSGIAGYRLYVGGASGTYTNVISGISATTATVPALVRGRTYFFAVTAYDTYGQESAFSKEITHTIPVVGGSPPVAELTAPANGAVYTAPATINLAATVTANGQAIRQVEFYNGAVLIGAATAAPYSFSWTNVGAGNYSVKAVAVYQSGGTLSSAEATVTVAAVQPPPEVTFAATSGVISSPFTSSGGAVLQPAETGLAGGGRAVYNFEITNAGNYTVSAVVSAPKDGQNSFYVNIDAEPTDPLMIWDIPLCSRPTRHTASWRGNGGPDCHQAQYSPKVFSLSAGPHQLIVRGREANTMLGAITVAAVPPRLQIRRGTGGGIILNGTSQPGQTCRILASEDLTAWRIIGTVTTDSLGAFEFSDPAGSGWARRMYRLLALSTEPTRLQVGAGAGGPGRLSAAGPAGQTWLVECSEDLRTWTVIGSVTLDASGRGEFSDPAGSTRPNRFYRLKAQ